jgi:non-ribosomal peptide synthetase component F/thioesterase domain-containing protein
MVVPEATTKTIPSGSEDVCLLPASLGQERCWALEQKTPGTPVLNVAVRFLLEGSLEPEFVKRSFNQIVARHEVLRTTFARVEDGPMQVISPVLAIDVPLIDVRCLESHRRDTEVDRLCLEEARKLFDLSSGPLLRVTLVRKDDEQYLLLLTVHHAIADYWSIGLMISEFATLYEAHVSQSKASLPELRIQYGDFAIWEREQAVGEVAYDQLAFWKQQLAKIERVRIPTDFQKTAASSQDANIVSRLLPLPLTNALKDLANREGATLYNVMLAALAVVIYRYTGQTDFVIGTQVAGRHNVELESLIGLFINTAVLRLELSGDPSFRSLLGRIQTMSTEALANSNVRFEQVLREICPKDYPRHDGLISLNFICQRDEVKIRSFSGIQLTVLPSKSQGALYDLNIFLILRSDGWRLSCEYKTELFEEHSIRRLIENYQNALENISQNPDRYISQFAECGAATSSVPLDYQSRAEPVQDPLTLDTQTLDATSFALGEGAKAPHQESMDASSDRRDIYAFPITLNQQRFWVLDQLMPGNPTLNMPVALRLSGPLSDRIVRRSLSELVRRHETLRTTFSSLDGRPVQVIHLPLEVELTEINLEELSEFDRESKAQVLLHNEALHPFDLGNGPLFRATLVRLNTSDHILMLTMPHIVCDGWSNGILVRELTSLYDAFSQGLASPLPEPSIQYADFAHWQNEWLQRESFDEDLAFWKRQLHGKLPLVDLPADRFTPAGLVSRGATETLLIPATFVSRLKDFCKREEITMFMLLLAGFKAMLSRLSGQEDILVGSPIAGRTPETEGIVGPFSYPISLRTDLTGNPTFRELTRRIRDVTVEALTHKDLPFGRILEELGVEQLRGRNPFFQIYFLHQVAFLQPVHTQNLIWSPYTWASPGTAFDLHLATVERTEGVINRLEYNPDMFDADTIKRMLRHYQSILDAVITDPELRISELPLSEPTIPDEPSAGIVVGDAKHPIRHPVLALIKQQSGKVPKKAVGISRHHNLTYQQLDTRSDALAFRLKRLKLDREAVIGICCDLSPDLMVAMVAVLKAGHPYVWFPPHDSGDTVQMRALLGRIKVVIADKHLTSWFVDKGIQFVFPLQRVIKGRAAVSEVLVENAESGSSACVRLTTGGRKAVIVTHEALAARTAAAVEAYQLVADDRVALISSAGIEEMLLSVMTTGATAVFVHPPSFHREIATIVEEQACTVLMLSARHFEAIVVAPERAQGKFFKRVRLIAVHGDKPATKAVDALAKLGSGSIRCVSSYGTAEIGSSAINWEAPTEIDTAASKRSEHLGVPANGFSVAVVDRYMQRAPIGVIGDICVGGDGLARAYYGDTELTAEKFFAVTGVGPRLFKTGDLGRYLPDGRLEFLGPPERHSNIRGFRKHFGDLEFALMRHRRVKCAVALSSNDPSGNWRTGVYVVLTPESVGRISSERDLNIRTELQELIAQQGEGYPGGLNILFMDNLRFNRNGNIDPLTLPHLNPTDVNSGSSYVAPQRVLESKLIEIWEDLLGIRPIGIADNFFDLGGHSLLASRLFNKINSLWGKTLPLSTLFQAPTIERLAEILRRDGWSPPTTSLVAIRSGGARAPLYVISGIGGNVVRFQALTRYLDSDQPVYALQPPGLDGNLPYITNIEDMAAHYIREIRILQPQGPYHLAGYSFGGLVAFQMGCDLLKHGDRIGLLALLDSPEWHYEARVARDISIRRRLTRYRIRIARVLFVAGRIQYLSERLGRRISRLVYSSLRRFGRLPRNVRSISEANSYAASNYRPNAFPGRLLLLRTRTHAAGAIRDDPTLGWGPLASEVEVHEVSGDHDNMTSEPHVQILAKTLNALLTRSQTSENLLERTVNQAVTRTDHGLETPVHTSLVRSRPFAGSLSGT